MSAAVKKKQKKKPAQQEKCDLSTLLKSKEGKMLVRTGRTLYKVAFILLMFIILALNMQPLSVDYAAGEIADEDIYYSSNTTSYISDLRTEAARNTAAASIGQIFVIDSTVTDNLISELESYKTALINAAGTMQGNQADTLSALRQQLPGTYGNDVLNYMLRMDASELDSQFALVEDFVRTAYEIGVTSEEVEAARQSIALSLSSSSITSTAESFYKSLIEGLSLPYNEAYDVAATRAAQDEAMAAVEDVSITVQSGEKIVGRGEVITAEQLEALEALGMAGNKLNFSSYVGLFTLVLTVCMLLFLYMRQYQQQFYTRTSSMLILGVVMALTLLLCKLISLLRFASATEASALIGYLLPVPTASLLIAVLLDRDTAIVSTVALSIFVGVIMNGQLAYVVNAMLGGLTATILAARLSQRSQFVMASVWIALVDVLIINCNGLIWQQDTSHVLVGMLFGLINGLLSAILAMGLLPFLESAFGVTTVIRLLELSNSNNPLLKRLIIEAPGTYNHSVLVGNLAEAAAEAIQANSLLVRVAAYYHDVGKLKRPQFYIENQRPGENPHDKLQPALSAKIITSHTIDGARMLREARFPQEIIDIVEQHHGNAELSFFYNKAVESALDPEDVKRSDFCYQGPRPQTKEAALVMLADSVQAAVQALKSNDAAAMEQRVHDVIQEKIDKQQLQESPLTFRDIETIARSFIIVLSGMNHIRIEYQKPDELPAATASSQTEEKVEEAQVQ